MFVQTIVRWDGTLRFASTSEDPELLRCAGVRLRAGEAGWRVLPATRGFLLRVSKRDADKLRADAGVTGGAA